MIIYKMVLLNKIMILVDVIDDMVRKLILIAFRKCK